MAGEAGHRPKRQRPPATVRFYIDADILGLAKVLVQVRPDVTYPGDPGGVVNKKRRLPCLITPQTIDREWIPEVAERGWVIITRDSAIQGSTREVAAVHEHGARMVALASADARNKFAQLEVFMSQWRRIEACCEQPGPFIHIATRTTFRSYGGGGLPLRRRS